MKKPLLAASVAALSLFAAGSAFAATGYATQHVNVRAGAGTGYAIVGSLSAGERVEIIDCDDGWCLTDEGYVSAAYLALPGSRYNGGDDEDDEDDERVSHIDENLEIDEDPLGLADDVPESIFSGFDD